MTSGERNLWNGLNTNTTLCFIAYMQITLDELYRKNLARIIEERGLKQKQVAEMIGTSPQYLNAMLRGDRGIGPDILTRLSRELHIEFWEFTITEKTPIVRSAEEQEKLYLFREEKQLGVAEDVERYERFRITEEKKKKGLAGENESARAQGSKKKAG